MDLSPPAAGLGDPLRRFRNKSKQPAKVELVIAPGDNLAVSENVAVQLEAATTALEATDRPAPPVEVVVEVDADPAVEALEDAAAAAKKAPAKKAPAKKAPAKKKAPAAGKA